MNSAEKDRYEKLTRLLFHLGKGLWRSVPIIGPLVDELVYKQFEDDLLGKVDESIRALPQEEFDLLIAKLPTQDSIDSLVQRATELSNTERAEAFQYFSKVMQTLTVSFAEFHSRLDVGLADLNQRLDKVQDALRYLTAKERSALWGLLTSTPHLVEGLTASRILWVDDYPRLLRPHRLWLSALGVEVVIVTNSRLAKERLGQERDFDLLIQDHMRAFPGGESPDYQAADLVRFLGRPANSDLKRIPMIIYTNESEESLGQNLKDALTECSIRPLYVGRNTATLFRRTLEALGSNPESPPKDRSFSLPIVVPNESEEAKDLL